MIFSLADISPVTAAGNAAPWDGTVDISWYDPSAAVYDIDTPAQLAGLAALVNGMTDPKCPKIIGNTAYIKNNHKDNVQLVGAGGGNVNGTVYYSNIDFAYKTVRLTSDLDMGGVYNQSAGTWSGPNWTPIGGKFPMIPGEAKGDCKVLDTRFNGVFDGQGHTVKNIYCDRYAAKGFPYSMAIGLIGYLGDASDLNSAITGTYEKGWMPTVRNVIVGKGYIYGRRMVGGVVGRVGKTNNGVIIENCANYADIKNTDSKGVGGVCGTGWGDGVIRNCYNSGSVTTTYSCPAGGICGSNGGMNIYNCYSTGRINTNGEKIGRGIGGHDSGSYTVGNCYYLSGSDDDDKSNGYYTGSTTKVKVSVSKLSSSDMKSSAFIDKLNASGVVFAADTKAINGGYPVLWYQNGSGAAVCKVSVQNPSSGGTVEADKQTAVYGQTVNFKAYPAAGWILDHFTVNGNPISTGFYMVTSDITVGAVFSEVKTASISIPANNDFYLVVQRTGYKLSGDQMVWVDNEELSNGDTVLQGNVITVLAHGYEGVPAADPDYEYNDAFHFTAEHTVKNADGTYTADGSGDVKITAERGMRCKSWINLADTGWYEMNPNQKTYTLSTAAQLAGLARLVNEKGITFSGKTILLGQDVSLENTDGTTGVRTWTPIGTSTTNSFRGTFDGQGHVIFDMSAWNDGSYCGLFGCCTDAVIRNFTITGSSKCESGSSYAAGIVANASACIVESCSSYVDVTAAGTHAGGIAASIGDGTAIKDCFNYGSIAGTSGIGGIAGVVNHGEDTLTGCGNFGTITAAGSETYGTGGITGRLAGKMESCVNKGAVKSSDRYTGGLAGYVTTRFSSEITCSRNTALVSSDSDNESAALGGLVGYAQYLSEGGNENTGTINTGGTFRSEYKDSKIGRVGDIKEIQPTGMIPDFQAAAKPIPKAQSGGFAVTFLANGKIVGTVSCAAGTSTVAEPAIPAITGCTAVWSQYQLQDRDITVKAIYRQNLVKDNAINESGVYYIPWFATGEIRIAGGLNVTLKGENGGTNGFFELCISAGDTTALTIDNVETTGSTTLLKLGKSNTLVLSGKNILTGSSDAKENEQPTVKISGDLLIRGSGSLGISAQINNAAVLVAAGSNVVQNSGALRIYKKDLLGFAGGAFYAAGSKVSINGGSFSGHTTSDNVAVLSADQLTITGGTVRVHAERSPQTLTSRKTVISGGSVLAIGHSGNSAAEKKYYYNGKSITNLTAAASVFRQILPFIDVFADNEYYDAIAYCCNKKYFSGTGSTTFSPGSPVTRAMFASVLYRMAGSPKVAGTVSFSDLNQDWYKKAVIWAVRSGITSGTGKTTFSPNAPITREQAAVFLYKFAQIRGKNIVLQNTGIVLPNAVSSWASQQVRWTLQKGIFTAESGVMDTPGANASRELLAQALMRYDALK